jgi:hypothetical protein
VRLLSPQRPEYGVNYGPGSVGFVHKRLEFADGLGAVVTAGIEYCTRWYRKPDYPVVTHVLGASGENLCIEANADGVDEDSLSPYFNDPKYTVYFRKPFGLTDSIAAAIVAKARTYVGCKYDDPLILADLLNNTLLGHAINGMTHDQVAEWLVKVMANPRKEICDEVWVLALAAQTQYAGLGTLAVPPALNDPQMLFGDERIWANDVVVIPGVKPTG